MTPSLKAVVTHSISLSESMEGWEAMWWHTDTEVLMGLVVQSTSSSMKVVMAPL